MSFASNNPVDTQESDFQSQSTIPETFGFDFAYNDDSTSILSSAPSGLLTPTVGSNPEIMEVRKISRRV
ncbi:hypothetical protein BDD12DRAFT_874957 [Trichophaea hybrida]|nr:hypothetical protein BDD12DRAFT_874957 [Trichophaea hybrida]